MSYVKSIVILNFTIVVIGYYFTGDGAHRTKEGYYQITGRMDDVLNISGHRLGTAEIEDAMVITGARKSFFCGNSKHSQQGKLIEHNYQRPIGTTVEGFGFRSDTHRYSSLFTIASCGDLHV